jgi:hypothetical protein
MRNRTVAVYGVLASVPWIFIEGYLYGIEASGELSSRPFWKILLASLFATSIMGIVCGALGAILFIKIQGRIERRLSSPSTTLETIILALIVWVLTDFGFSQPAQGGFFGMMAWAVILAHLIDSEARKPKEN